MERPATNGDEHGRPRLSRPLTAWACFLIFFGLTQLDWRPSKIGTLLELVPFSTGLFLALSSIANRRTRIAGLLWSVIYLFMAAAMILESWNTFWRYRF